MLRLRSLRIFCICIFSTVSLTVWADEVWKFDPSTLSGRIKIIRSFIHRHPAFTTENIQFRRSPFQIVEGSNAIRKKLGANLNSTEISNTTLIHLQYAVGAEAALDPAKIEKLKTQLMVAIRELNPQIAHLTLAEGVELVLASPANLQKKRITQWLKVSPLLYQANGKPVHGNLEAVVQNLNELSAAELENLYTDFLPHHLLPKIKTVHSGHSFQVPIQSFQNQFLRREVSSTFSLKTQTGGSTSVRSLSLEKVPPEFAAFRGSFGGDCSMSSVPYYGLVEGTDTYWIYKNGETSAKPIGYALVTTAEIEGKKFPYLVSLNSPLLSSADTQAILKMIADEKMVNQIVVPNLTANPNLINFGQIKNGLSTTPSQQVVVKLPNGWDLANAPENGYSNYYASEQLKNARILDTEKLPVTLLEHEKHTFPSHYEMPKGNTLDLPLIERALLSAQAQDDELISFTPWKKTQVNNTLGVTSEITEAGKILNEASHRKPLTVEQFRFLEKHLHFGIADLDILDVHSRPQSIETLHAEIPGLATETEWQNIARRTHQKLLKQLSLQDYNGAQINFIFSQDAKLSPLLKGENVLDNLQYLTQLEKNIGLDLSKLTHRPWSGLGFGNHTEIVQKLFPDLEKKLLDPKMSSHLRAELGQFMFHEGWHPSEEVFNLVYPVIFQEKNAAVTKLLSLPGQKAYDRIHRALIRSGSLPTAAHVEDLSLPLLDRTEIAKALSLDPEAAATLYHLHQKDLNGVRDLGELFYSGSSAPFHSDEIRIQAVKAHLEHFRISGATLIEELKTDRRISNFNQIFHWMREHTPKILTEAQWNKERLEIRDKLLLDGRNRYQSMTSTQISREYASHFTLGDDPEFLKFIEEVKAPLDNRARFAFAALANPSSPPEKVMEWLLNRALLNPQESIHSRSRILEELMGSEAFSHEVKASWIERILRDDQNAEVVSEVMGDLARWRTYPVHYDQVVEKVIQKFPRYETYLKLFPGDWAKSSEFKRWYRVQGKKYGSAIAATPQCGILSTLRNIFTRKK